jgi:hypothetical protein
MKELKWRYPGLNKKTAAKGFIDLCGIVLRHSVIDDNTKRLIRSKIFLASLISDCFTIPKAN